MSKSGSKTPTKTAPKIPEHVLAPSNIVKFQLTKTDLWVMGGIGSLALFFYLFSPILMPFLVSLGFAYAFHPLVMRLQQWGLSRSIATIIIVVAVISLIVSLILIALPFLRDELTALSATLPDTLAVLFERYSPAIKSIVAAFSQDVSGQLETTLMDHASQVVKWVLKALAGLFTNTLALANIVSLVILSPLLIFYLLRDWPKMIGYLETLVPPPMKQSTHTLFADINDTISGFFRGQALVCLIIGLYYTAGLYVIGVNYAFTVGLISGVLTFIPYVGFFTGLVAASGVALAQFEGLHELFFVIALYGVGNVLEGFVLVPQFVGGKLGLHPLWVIFALLGGGLLFGFIGLLLAMPLAGTVSVLLRFIGAKYKHHLALKT